MFELTTVRRPCQRNREGGRLLRNRCSLILLVPELVQRPRPGHRKHAPSRGSVVPGKVIMVELVTGTDSKKAEFY